MRNRLEGLDTGGGHIVVALFVFLVGVLLVVAHVSEGKEVMIGALASLWTSLRIQKRDEERKEQN